MIQLRGYQEDISTRGLAILKHSRLLCLAMQVRTGKTITALATFEKRQRKSVAFVTKKKAILSIQTDYDLLAPSFKIVITNFEQAHKLNPDDFDGIIVDESHSCGSFPKPSKRTLIIKKLCVGKDVILLSGTFSPESYSQLYHQLSLSSFSPFIQYRNFYYWAKAGFVNIKQKRIGTGQLINDYSDCNGDMVWRYCKHLFITFTQEEAGFTAPVDEHFLTVKMSDEVKSIYKNMEKDGIYIRKIPYSNREIAATVSGGGDLINKLSQIASGTLIFDNEDKGIIIDWSKALFIQREFAGKKIAVFYRYKSEFELLKSFFPNYTESPEEFNACNDPIHERVTFLGQIQSVREGVDLSTADCLVAYNIDFSATSYFQMRARGQSKERKGSLPFYWIFSDCGIEKKIYNAVSNKMNFTYSYYKKENARKRNTSEDQKRIGAARMARSQAG